MDDNAYPIKHESRHTYKFTFRVIRSSPKSKFTPDTDIILRGKYVEHVQEKANEIARAVVPSGYYELALVEIEDVEHEGH